MDELIPIDDILGVLKYRKRMDLAKLLRGAVYSLNISNTYGSRAYSQCTTVEIYSSLEKQELLEALSPEDKRTIVKAFHVPYPVKDHSIEITGIDFFVNPNAPFPTGNRPAAKIDTIDFEYIREQIAKCDEKNNTGDYDGAITSARTLVESVCKYILDEENLAYKQNDDLPELYKKVSKILSMLPSIYEEKPFKEVLSGCFSIINGVASIRNLLGDAHGKSRKVKYKISERHSVLTVTVAKAFSDYLYLTYKEKNATSNLDRAIKRTGGRS